MVQLKYPWANGQGERMNRPPESDVERYHYDNYNRMRERLVAVLDAHNFDAA